MTSLTDNTLFIEVETGKYPVTFAMIRDLKKASVSFGPNPPIDDVRQFGYEPVADSIIPTGDVVVEGPPELINGVWTRTWIVRSFEQSEVASKLQEAKDLLTGQIMSIRENDLAYGMKFNFSDGTVGGIQMRPKDRTNLIGIRLEAYAYIQAGVTGVLIDFRSLENVTRQLPPDEVVAMTDACTAFTKTIYAASWALKDQVTNAATIEDLPALSDLPKTFITQPAP